MHQDYLLHRLRELAAGGAISAYRWNAGSTTFNSRPWKEEYPTDTAVRATDKHTLNTLPLNVLYKLNNLELHPLYILLNLLTSYWCLQILLHLFATYLDQQLPPDIAQPEGRMFSSIHLIKAPEKPPRTTNRPLLYLSQVQHPYR